MVNESKEWVADSLNELSMTIILHAGNARKNVSEALIALEQEDYNQSQKLLAEAKTEVVVAHKMQTSTLQQEAEGKQIRYSILFSHAQDTLMTVQSELFIADHLVTLFKKLVSMEGAK
ncbi:PTS lactose/cellobiose transporter subunit IIA [Paenilisteria rocourtiae]|uniref:PTS system cellobiose-specific IIA component n=1 Tax=Listeria rocourtiae TaxID=647910 RepID=A0A4R6ZS87_9LIST|nr:PTS lactose/cellobiose transporter subunit IIA [Listeria rocourtiae]MBC1435571.1 PTS lactose/cellobiose transporter subunit IIA [Listeria rocourtiae]TDR55577.1 PTS system cellobiose-specific IIA component [Listeria rocourtiae]